MTKYLLIIIITFYQYTSFGQRYSAELILQNTNIEVKRGELVKNFYYEIRINNRLGEKYSKIEIPFSKLNKLSNIKAYIKDSKGIIIKKLKKKDIVKRNSISEFSFYEDYFVKEFILRHNLYPYTIVYSYQIKSNEFLYLDHWIPLIDEKIPTLEAHLRVKVPRDYEIFYKNNKVDKPIIEESKKYLTFKWNAKYLKIVKPEIFSPPILNFIPSVLINPKEFNYEIDGAFNSWESYGYWQYNLLKGINELPKNEKKKITALIDGIESKMEKIKILYYYLQNETRYLNITIETGGLKPYPASYVALNKYGDCKALTNYFKSILHFINVKSYYTNIYAGSKIKKINTKFPAQQFNHSILYIPQNNKDLWLDCTSKAAFNYLGTFTQNRNAFVIDKQKSYFIKTPKLDSLDVLELRNIKIKSINDTTVANFKNIYKGKLYERLINVDKSLTKTEKLKILRKYFVEKGFELTDFHIFYPNRDSAKIVFSYEAISQRIYNYYDNDILINNIPFTLPQFEMPKDRKLPIQINYPIYKRDTLIYEIPEGFKLSSEINNHYSLINKFGSFDFKIIQEEKNTILLIKKLLINSGNYSISEYVNFYKFYKYIIEIENKTSIFLVKKH